MSKSAVYLINTSSQTVADGGIISLGTIARRYGCNCNASGTNASVSGTGYYFTDASFTLVPSGAGTVTISILKDGNSVPGATASVTVAGTGTSVNISLNAIIREYCCCDKLSTISFQLSGVSADVTNASVVVIKI